MSSTLSKTTLKHSKCGVSISVLISFVRSKMCSSWIATKIFNFVLMTRDNLGANSDGMDAAADEGIEMRVVEA